MFKLFGLVVLVLVAAVLAVAATKPDTFRVQRSASVNAPPEKIFALIDDLRAFNTWNPYEKKDPNLMGRYYGPASGKGAVYTFEGNKDIGKGSIEITESSPSSKVAMKLRMIEPFQVENAVEFTLQPEGGGTRVTWAMQGESPFLAKIIHVFFDMDAMVGKDFAAGLAGLKAIAEK